MEDGFIMFTVGSVIQMNDMPSKILEIFLRSSARLQNFHDEFFWQWKDLKNEVRVTSNILLSDWLPQQDILGNNHVGLFICSLAKKKSVK